MLRYSQDLLMAGLLGVETEDYIRICVHVFVLAETLIDETIDETTSYETVVGTYIIAVVGKFVLVLEENNIFIEIVERNTGLNSLLA